MADYKEAFAKVIEKQKQGKIKGTYTPPEMESPLLDAEIERMASLAKYAVKDTEVDENNFQTYKFPESIFGKNRIKIAQTSENRFFINNLTQSDVEKLINFLELNFGDGPSE